MFRIAEKRVLFNHKAERLEKHGEEDVLAADLEFSLETSNVDLAMFHPELRAALYRGTEAEAQAELVEDKNHMPVLRFPEISESIKWAGQPMKEAELRIHTHKNPERHLVFAETTVGKFRLECKDGGTVVIRFRAQIYPSDEGAGKLSGLLRDGECTISVTPKAEDEGASGEPGKP